VHEVGKKDCHYIRMHGQQNIKENLMKKQAAVFVS